MHGSRTGELYQLATGHSPQSAASNMRYEDSAYFDILTLSNSSLTHRGDALTLPRAYLVNNLADKPDVFAAKSLKRLVDALGLEPRTR